MYVCIICNLETHLALESSSSRIVSEYDFFVSPSLQKKAVKCWSIFIKPTGVVENWDKI